VEDKSLSGKVLEGFIFTNIFKTFRFAIQPGKMAIALLAVAALVIAGRLMDLSPTVIASPGVIVEDIAAPPESGMFTARPATELHASLAGSESWSDYVATYNDIGTRIGVFAAIWEFCSARFDDIAIAVVKCDVKAMTSNLSLIGGAAWWALRYHWMYTMAYLVISLLTMSLAGGAICRSAALQFAGTNDPALSNPSDIAGAVSRVFLPRLSGPWVLSRSSLASSPFWDLWGIFPWASVRLPLECSRRWLRSLVF
jgi:hypothetical protein